MNQNQIVGDVMVLLITTLQGAVVLSQLCEISCKFLC